MSYLTHDEAALRDVAGAAIDRITAAAAQGSAVADCRGGAMVSVHDGEVGTARRDGHQMLRVTVHRDGRSGTASSTSFDADAVARTVSEALTIAAAVQPDDDTGLADPAWMAMERPEVPLWAPDDRGPGALIDDALTIEAAGQGDGHRVSEAGAATQDGAWALATTTGFCRSSRFSHQSRWCQIIAPDGDAAVSDVAHSEDRRLAMLDPADAIAALAIERTLSARGAHAIASGRMPVLFLPSIAAILLSELVGALSGVPQYSGQTFLPDAIGRQVLPDTFDLLENPFEPFGLASAPFDGDGVAGSRRAVIAGGVVQSLFLAARSARRLRLRSTGNGNGPYNLSLCATQDGGDRAAMLAHMGEGLVVTQLLGGATDPVRGTWTRAVAGFRVEAGGIAHPVRDVTLAGSLPDMLRSIVAVGADVERMGPFRTGSILVDAMQVGGAA
jgi:PmbA protein